MQPNRLSTFVWFYTAKVLANLAAFAFLPLLPLYLTQRNAGILQVGMFFSLLAIARLAFGLVGGWLADRAGHLRSLALGSLLGTGAFAVLLGAPTWQWVYAGMVLIYAASALTTPAQSAFIGSAAGPNRGKAFGLMNTLHSAAQMGGPVLGGWLAETYGFRTLFQVTGSLYLLSALIRLALASRARVSAPAPDHSDHSFSGDLGRMRALLLAGGLLAWMLLADGFGDIAMALVETYQPIYLEQAGVSLGQIGLIGSLAYGATLLSHSISGWMVDRYGERLPILLSFALTALGILGFAASRSAPGFAASWTLIGLMWGFGATGYDALISKATPPEHRGLAYGLFSTAQGFFSLPVPLIGGWLYLWGPAAPFAAAAAVAALGAALVLYRFPPGVVQDESVGAGALLTH